VPIFLNKKVVAGLSVFLPEYRCSVSHKKEIIQHLQEAAQVISQRLAHNNKVV
jgi:DNA-binding IclR family transcriptional regulator